MMLVMQWILFVPLGLLSVVTILWNWAIVIRRTVRKRFESVIPGFGALFGVAALLVAPFPEFRRWWYIPLLCDIGTIIFVYSMAMIAVGRYRR